MWNPYLTNDKHTIHEILPRLSRPTFAFLGRARLGKKFANDQLLEEKVEMFFFRAVLVRGVHAGRTSRASLSVSPLS